MAAGLRPKGGGMDAAVSKAVRRKPGRRSFGVAKTPKPKSARMADFG
jgi:hypothetical protein